jgi:hypothetical protein
MLFTVHGGFGTFRSSGAKVVWLEGCVYKTFRSFGARVIH